ncbi:MAG TPA: YkvA family protein [Clostridia bacterium]|nr:YkvA family protein [Clostridia bacterium]
MQIIKLKCVSCDVELTTYKVIGYTCPNCGSIVYPQNSKYEEKFNKFTENIDDKDIDKVIDKKSKIYKLLEKLKMKEIIEIGRELFNILLKEETSYKIKVIIAAAFTYLLAPIDLIPDVIPVIGYYDDIAIMLLAFKMISEISGIIDISNIKKRIKYQNGQIIFNVCDNTENLDYNYIEEKNRKIWIVSKADLKKFGYSNINNSIIANNKNYLLHKYIPKLLISMDEYDELNFNSIIEEQSNIAKMLGAKKVSFKIKELSNNNNKADQKFNFKGVFKNEASLDRNNQSKNYIEKNYVFRDFDNIYFEYINNLIWLFTDENISGEIIKERILNNTEKQTFNRTIKTTNLLNAKTRAEISRVNSELKVDVNISKSIEKEIEINIEYFDLPDDVKINRDKVYENIIKRINDRRDKLELEF